MSDPVIGQLGITGQPTYFINSGDMRLIIASDAPTVVQNGKSASIVPTSLTDSNSNVAAGAYTDIDSTVASADGNTLDSVTNRWTAQSNSTTNGNFSFGLTDAPADYATFNQVTMTVRARVTGSVGVDLATYRLDISGTNAPTDVVTFNQTDAGAGFIERSFTNSSVTPSASDVDGWTARAYQWFFFDEPAQPSSNLNLEIDEIELTLEYFEAINLTRFPPVGSLTISSDAPTVVPSAVLPTTDSLTITGQLPFLGSADSITAGAPDGLAFGGDAVSLSYTVVGTTGSVTITEASPSRWTGMQFDSDAPTLGESRVVSPAVGSVAFTGNQPDIFGDNTVVPPTALAQLPIGAQNDASLVIYTPFIGGDYDVLGLSWTIGSVPTGALSLTGQAPSTNPLNPDSLSLAGQAPQVKQSISDVPVVIIQEGASEGVRIYEGAGPGQTQDIPSNYLICDRTGFRVKVKHDLHEEWTGSMVRGDSFDKRHPQSFGSKAGPDHQEGPIRPEPTDAFIEDLYPDGVNAADLGAITEPAVADWILLQTGSEKLLPQTTADTLVLQTDD